MTDELQQRADEIYAEEKAEKKEWTVDWEVEVDVTLSTRVKVSGCQIFEGATPEEAAQAAEDELYVSESDIDIASIDPLEFDIDVDDSSFKVERVSEWTL